MAAGKTVTFEGSTDRSVVDPGAVEIDGTVLEKGVPVEGLSADQVERLEAMPYHRFTVGDEAKLTGDALDARVKELGIDGAANMNADEKRAAVADAEAAQGGDS